MSNDVLIGRSFLDAISKAEEEDAAVSAELEIEQQAEDFEKAVKQLHKILNSKKVRKAIHDDDEFEEYEDDDDLNYDEVDEPEIYGGDEVREFEDGVELEDDDEVLVLDKATKKQVLDIVLKKGMEGKLSQLDVTKIQNRISKNVPLTKSMMDLIDDEELNGAVVEILEKGQTRVFGDTAVSTLNKAFNDDEAPLQMLRKGSERTKRHKQAMFNLIQEKADDGEITQVQMTSMTNRVERNQNLSPQMEKALGRESLVMFSKAFEDHGEEEDSENETDEDERRSKRRDEAMQRNRSNKSKDYTFTDDNGKKRTVTKSAIYRQIRKCVANKSMDVMDVTKAENRMNKGIALPKDFLPKLFSV